jgi:hypothetical protein
MKTSLTLISLFFVALIGITEAKVVSDKKILISVGDLYENENKEWKREMCKKIHTLANQVVESGVSITCREFDTNNFLDKELPKYSKNNNYHLRIIRDYKQDIGIDVTNWSRVNESDFTSLGWNFNKEKEGANITQEQAIVKAIANFFFYVDNERAYKAGLLVQGSVESNQIEFDDKTQTFRDKVTDMPISIENAYSLFESESPRKKNYLRAGVEIGVLLSSAMGIYYKNLVFNQQDFDYGFKDGVKQKLTGEAMLFDDNDKKSNYGHEWAGVMYYQVARSNGFNALESFLIAEASSAAWEFMEYHEVFSINDQIMTPVGGYVLGEATYQISCALVAKNNIAAKALGYTLNPNLGINHAMDAHFKGDKYAAQPDCKKPRWSDISMRLGMEKGQKPYLASENKGFNVGMDAQVINIQDYDKAGQERKIILDTSMTKMIVEANGNQGLVDLNVIAQVVFAAYHQKDLKEEANGNLRGYEFVIGLGSGSTWRDRGAEEGDKNEDFFGTINILGANAHANIHINGFNIRADFAMYGDFSMVKAYALEPYLETHDKGNMSSVMQRKGNYWGYGASTLSAISVEKGKWTVGYSGQFSTAKSINKRNRVEAKVDDRFHDTILVNRVFVKYALTKNLSLQVDLEQSLRVGSASGVASTKSGTERRVVGSLAYKF